MKERLAIVLKWFLITLGVIFIIEILIVTGAVIGLTKFAHMPYEINVSPNKNLREIQPIIKYVEDYKTKNGSYPNTIENVKIKKGLSYKYKVSDDTNCYTITTKKDKLTKQYQRCSANSDNSSTSSESYVEYQE